MHKNVLVVGQGLAGSLLGFFLHDKGVKVRIIDACNKENCSSVSSGIINPITGRRFVKSWLIDELIPVAVSTYRRLEAALDLPLLKETAIVRTLHGIKDENQWIMQSGKPGYDRYMSETPPMVNYASHLKTTNRFATVKEGYRINAGPLISGVRSWFERQGILRRIHFEHSQLVCRGNAYRYGDESCRIEFESVIPIFPEDRSLRDFLQ